MKKKFYWFIGVLVGVVLILAITNPTTRDLKDHIQGIHPKYKITITRTNYFIFSKYKEVGVIDTGYPITNSIYENEYTGFFGRFYLRIIMTS